MYLLVVQDYFSKWLEAVPIKNQESLTVVIETNKIFCRFCPPRALSSDQGRIFEFTSSRDVVRYGGLKNYGQRHTTHKYMDLFERANRTLSKTNRKTCENYSYFASNHSAISL
ncbi:hypothetical protein RF11_03582 [Thelohanellus kitauei]|uniref:Integrase catalytic domain-containing protein n=1 Tax=Thelohanellus kitauei TaxID=669202 RepID=A0A0C2MRK6_THEKT|nr:hypothetical protein RF11_03582 [Thelohanellus kitauei]